MRRQKSAINNSYLKLIFAIILLIASLELIFFGFFSDLAVNYHQRTLASFTHISHYLRERSLLDHEFVTLNDTNQQLSRQIAELKFLDLKNQILESENQNLKQLLKISQSVSQPVIARILNHTHNVNDQSLYAAKPSADVFPGMLAVNESGIAIARVASVTQNSIRLLLLNDKRSAVPVIVSGKQINAVAVGNGSNIDLLHIPIDSGIRPGDTVQVVSNQPDRSFYYTIGIVESVQNSPDKTFLLAKLSQHHVTQGLQWIMLI